MSAPSRPLAPIQAIDIMRTAANLLQDLAEGWSGATPDWADWAEELREAAECEEDTITQRDRQTAEPEKVLTISGIAAGKGLEYTVTLLPTHARILIEEDYAELCGDITPETARQLSNSISAGLSNHGDDPVTARIDSFILNWLTGRPDPITILVKGWFESVELEVIQGSLTLTWALNRQHAQHAARAIQDFYTPDESCQ